MANEIFKTCFYTGDERFIFDAVFSTQHDSSLNITEHPVQSGANISDHAFKEPRMLTFDIGMSDVMTSVIPGQFQGDSRSINAYRKIVELQDNRLPITVATKLGTYNNMLVETITTTEDEKTIFGLRATITLREVFVVNVQTVKISARPQKSNSSNDGVKNAIKEDSSLLSSFFN